MSKFLNEIRDFQGEEEAKIFLECKRLIEQFLKEDENFLAHLEHIGKDSKAMNVTRFDIERMKYALGKIDKYPNFREYFKKND